MNKAYFMNRLANGEDMNAIGAEIAAAMNAAIAEHNAKIEAEKAAKADHEAAKRELIEEMVEIVKELAILEGMDEGDLNVSDEEIDEMVHAFTEMFSAMREIKKLVASVDVSKIAAPKAKVSVIKSDDDVLANFIKQFA